MKRLMVACVLCAVLLGLAGCGGGGGTNAGGDGGASIVTAGRTSFTLGEVDGLLSWLGINDYSLDLQGCSPYMENGAVVADRFTYCPFTFYLKDGVTRVSAVAYISNGDLVVDEN